MSAPSAIMPPSFAIITPSYAGDLDRCALLCASIDRFVSGHSMHYILVEDRDAPLFRHLEGARCRIILDSDILPAWLKPYRDPFHKGRRIWTSLRWNTLGTWPMRGWHVQQLRKLAIARHIPETIMLHCDSDVVFIKPFVMGQLMNMAGQTRLYRVPKGITADMTQQGHVGWCKSTASMLGLTPPSFPASDFINNLISWRSANIIALHEHIEARSGRDWVSTISRNRSFSEAMIYGMFVDHVMGATAGHYADDFPLCRTWWMGEIATPDTIDAFVAGMEPGQVAVGVQSFIAAPLQHLWSLVR
jgi:hypothetical protein